MKINKIKIPYIFIENNCNIKAIEILKRVEKLFNLHNIPYIIKEGKIYKLYINKKIYILNNIEEVLYISDICIVIEAQYTIYAMEVMDYYIDLGKDIACFPWDISNKYSKFSNNLIRDGALCITSYNMILEYLTTFA